MHALSGSNDNSIVSSEENFFVIDDLDTCVEYEVSVGVVNEKDKSTDAVTGNMRIEMVGNYHVQMILLYL